jgi:hypothetical protein
MVSLDVVLFIMIAVATGVAAYQALQLWIKELVERVDSLRAFEQFMDAAIDNPALPRVERDFLEGIYSMVAHGVPSEAIRALLNGHERPGVKETAIRRQALESALRVADSRRSGLHIDGINVDKAFAVGASLLLALAILWVRRLLG